MELLSSYTYGDILFQIDMSIDDTDNHNYQRLLDLRTEFLRRVSHVLDKIPHNEKSHGISLWEHRFGIDEMTLISGFLPFADRKIPEKHIQWLQQQLQQIGLPDIVQIHKPNILASTCKPQKRRHKYHIPPQCSQK